MVILMSRFAIPAMRRVVTFLIVALLAVVPLRGADAHAMLRDATPPVGGTLRVAPTEVRLYYSEAIDAPLCSVHVTDSQGTRVDRDDLHRDPDDRNRLVIGLQPLPPGDYRVEWTAVSVDTHKTEGAYGFTVLEQKP